MGLRSWIAKKIMGSKEKSYSFTDDDRENAIEIRTSKKEIRQIQLSREKMRAEIENLKMQAQLDELKDKLGMYDDEEEDEREEPQQNDMAQLFQALALMGAQNQQSGPVVLGGPVSPSPPPAPSPSSPPITLTPEMLTSVEKKLPVELKMAVKGGAINDEQFQGIAKQLFAYLKR